MGGKIPRPIRVQVIRAWLEGKSRDKIAGELKISTGAVSGIIKDFRKDDFQFDLLLETSNISSASLRGLFAFLLTEDSAFSPTRIRLSLNLCIF
jgi:hypothetical protein